MERNADTLTSFRLRSRLNDLGNRAGVSTGERRTHYHELVQAGEGAVALQNLCMEARDLGPPPGRLLMQGIAVLHLPCSLSAWTSYS